MNKRLTIAGKEIESAGIVGLGKSSIGIIEYISRNHKNVTFYLRSDKPVDSSSAMRVTNFEEIKECSKVFDDIHEDVLFLSPSVRRDRPELHYAKERGVIISSDSEFFYEKFSGDCFAVSGSDGKSTTAKILSMLLDERYGNAPAIGNIGAAMTPLLDSKIKAAVTELSSFQLMSLSPASKRAVITNISPNHLDWHNSFEEYRQAKENLIKNASERVFNCDCPYSREMLSRYGAFALFSAALSEKELMKLARAQVYITKKDGHIIANGEKILDTGAVFAASEHNYINFMAAIATSFGLVSLARIEEVAKSFSGLRHRNEFIGSFEGISFFESSIDSSPKRTATTLAAHKPLTLILGGRSKGLDYAELIPSLKEKALAIILTGENAEEILCAISGCSDFPYDRIPILSASNLGEAVERAISVTKQGGTILFSPASTSFDAFRDFEERGDFFTDTVKNFYRKSENYK